MDEDREGMRYLLHGERAHRTVTIRSGCEIHIPALPGRSFWGNQKVEPWQILDDSISVFEKRRSAAFECPED